MVSLAHVHRDCLNNGMLTRVLAATLDRYEVPFFGPLASSILDDE